MTREELKAAAVAMLDRAYIPYSHFPVGAALECSDGTVFTEHHVEPGLRQGAVPALSAGLLQRLPGIRHPPPPPSCLSPGHHTGGGCPSAAQPNGSGLFAAIVTQNLPPRNEV